MQQQGEGNITKTPQIDRHFNVGESNISEPQTGTNTAQQQFKGAVQTSENLYSQLRDVIQSIQRWMEILQQDTQKNATNQELILLMTNTLQRLQIDVDPQTLDVNEFNEFNENIMDSPQRSSEQSNYSDALQILSNNKQFENLHDKMKFLEDMLYRDKANLPPLSPPYTPTRKTSEKLNDKQILYKQALSQIGSEVSELELNFKKHKDDLKILNETFAQDFQEFSRDSSQIQQQQVSILDIPQQSNNLVSFEKSSLNDQYSEIKRNFKLSVTQLKQKFGKKILDLSIALQNLKHPQFKQETKQQIITNRQEITNYTIQIVDAFQKIIASRDQVQLKSLQNEEDLQTNATNSEQSLINQQKQEIEELKELNKRLEIENDQIIEEYQQIQKNSIEKQIESQQQLHDLNEEQQIEITKYKNELNELQMRYEILEHKYTDIQDELQTNRTNQIQSEDIESKDIQGQEYKYQIQQLNDEEFKQINTQLVKENQELKEQLQLQLNTIKQNTNLLGELHENINSQQQIIMQQNNEIKQLQEQIQQLNQFKEKLVNDNQQLQLQQEQNKKQQKCENCIKKNQKIEELTKFKSQFENLDLSDEEVPQKQNTTQKQNQKDTKDQTKDLISKSMKWLQIKLKEELNRNNLQFSGNLIKDFSTLTTYYNELKIAFDATNETINIFQAKSKQEWLALSNQNKKLEKTIVDLQNQVNTLKQVNEQQQTALQQQQIQIAQQQHNLIIKDEDVLKLNRDILQLTSENQGYHRQVIQNDLTIAQLKGQINSKENQIQVLKQLQIQFIQGFNDLQGELQNIFNSQIRIISEYYEYLGYENPLSATQVKNQSDRVFIFKIQQQNDFENQFQIQKKQVQELKKQIVERQNAFVDTIERERNQDD